MKSHRVFEAISIALFASAAIGAGQESARNQPGDISRSVGEWSGSSRCTAKNTACHDETVVYHIAELRDRPGFVSVSADKIVDGKPINMGTLEFKYEQTEHTLVCRYSQGEWRLKVSGDVINGSLNLSDGTQFREVVLHRKN